MPYLNEVEDEHVSHWTQRYQENNGEGNQGEQVATSAAGGVHLSVDQQIQNQKETHSSTSVPRLQGVALQRSFHDEVPRILHVANQQLGALSVKRESLTNERGETEVLA